MDETITPPEKLDEQDLLMSLRSLGAEGLAQFINSIPDVDKIAGKVTKSTVLALESFTALIADVHEKKQHGDNHVAVKALMYLGVDEIVGFVKSKGLEIVAKKVLQTVATRAGAGALAGPAAPLVMAGLVAMELTLWSFDIDLSAVVLDNLSAFFADKINRDYPDNFPPIDPQEYGNVAKTWFQLIESPSDEHRLFLSELGGELLRQSPLLKHNAFSFLDEKRNQAGHDFLMRFPEQKNDYFGQIKSQFNDYIKPYFSDPTVLASGINWPESDPAVFLANIDFSKSRGFNSNLPTTEEAFFDGYFAVNHPSPDFETKPELAMSEALFSYLARGHQAIHLYDFNTWENLIPSTPDPMDFFEKVASTSPRSSFHRITPYTSPEAFYQANPLFGEAKLTVASALFSPIHLHPTTKVASEFFYRQAPKKASNAPQNNNKTNHQAFASQKAFEAFIKEKLEAHVADKLKKLEEAKSGKSQDSAFIAQTLTNLTQSLKLGSQIALLIQNDSLARGLASAADLAHAIEKTYYFLAQGQLGSAQLMAFGTGLSLLSRAIAGTPANPLPVFMEKFPELLGCLSRQIQAIQTGVFATIEDQLRRDQQYHREIREQFAAIFYEHAVAKDIIESLHQQADNRLKQQKEWYGLQVTERIKKARQQIETQTVLSPQSCTEIIEAALEYGRDLSCQLQTGIHPALATCSITALAKDALGHLQPPVPDPLMLADSLRLVSQLGEKQKQSIPQKSLQQLRAAFEEVKSVLQQLRRSPYLTQRLSRLRHFVEKFETGEITEANLEAYHLEGSKLHHFVALALYPGYLDLAPRLQLLLPDASPWHLDIKKEARQEWAAFLKNHLNELEAELVVLQQQCLQLSPALSGFYLLDAAQGQVDKVYGFTIEPNHHQVPPQPVTERKTFPEQARLGLSLLQHHYQNSPLPTAWVCEKPWQSGNTEDAIHIRVYSDGNQRMAVIATVPAISRRDGQLNVSFSCEEQRSRSLAYLKLLSENPAMELHLIGYSAGGTLAAQWAASLNLPAIAFDAIGYHKPYATAAKPASIVHYILQPHLLNTLKEGLHGDVRQIDIPEQHHPYQLLHYTTAAVVAQCPAEVAQLLSTHRLSLFFAIANQQWAPDWQAAPLFAHHLPDEQLEILQILLHAYGDEQNGYEFFPQSLPKTPRKAVFTRETLRLWVNIAQQYRGETGSELAFLYQLMDKADFSSANTQTDYLSLLQHSTPQALYEASLKHHGARLTEKSRSFKAQFQTGETLSIQPQLRWAHTLYLMLYMPLAGDFMLQQSAQTLAWPHEWLGSKPQNIPLHRLSLRWLMEKAKRQNPHAPERALWNISVLLVSTASLQSPGQSEWRVDPRDFYETVKSPAMPVMSIYARYREALENQPDNDEPDSLLHLIEQRFHASLPGESAQQELERKANLLKQAAQVSGAAFRDYLAGAFDALGSAALTLSSGLASGVFAGGFASVTATLGIASLVLAFPLALISRRRARKQRKALEAFIAKLTDDVVAISRQLGHFEQHFYQAFELLSKNRLAMHQEEQMLLSIDLNQIKESNQALRALYDKGVKLDRVQQEAWIEKLTRVLRAVEDDRILDFKEAMKGILYFIEHDSLDLQWELSSDGALYEMNPAWVTQAVIDNAWNRVPAQNRSLEIAALPNLEAYARGIMAYVDLRRKIIKESEVVNTDHNKVINDIEQRYGKITQQLSLLRQHPEIYQSLLVQIKEQINLVEKEVLAAENRFRNDYIGRNIDYYFDDLERKINEQYDALYKVKYYWSKVNKSIRLDFINIQKEIWQQEIKKWSSFNKENISLDTWYLSKEDPLYEWDKMSEEDRLLYDSSYFLWCLKAPSPRIFDFSAVPAHRTARTSNPIFSFKGLLSLTLTEIYQDVSYLYLIICLHPSTLESKLDTNAHIIMMQAVESADATRKGLNLKIIIDPDKVETTIELILKSNDTNFQILKRDANGKSLFISISREDYDMAREVIVVPSNNETVPEWAKELIATGIKNYDNYLASSLKTEISLGTPLYNALVTLNKLTTELHHLVYLTLNPAYQQFQPLFETLLPSLSLMSPPNWIDFLSQPGASLSGLAQQMALFSTHIEGINSTITHTLPLFNNTTLSGFIPLDLARGRLQHWVRSYNQSFVPVPLPPVLTPLAKLRVAVTSFQISLQQDYPQDITIILQEFLSINHLLNERGIDFTADDCHQLERIIDEHILSPPEEALKAFTQHILKVAGIVPDPTNPTAVDFLDAEDDVVFYDCETDYEAWVDSIEGQKDPALSYWAAVKKQIDTFESDSAIHLKTNDNKSLRLSRVHDKIEMKERVTQSRHQQCATFEKPQEVVRCRDGDCEAFDLVKDCETSYQKWQAQYQNLIEGEIQKHLNNLDESSKAKKLPLKSGNSVSVSVFSFFNAVSQRLNQELASSYNHFCNSVIRRNN